MYSGTLEGSYLIKLKLLEVEYIKDSKKGGAQDSEPECLGSKAISILLKVTCSKMGNPLGCTRAKKY
jgi:hypothetical protein